MNEAGTLLLALWALIAGVLTAIFFGDAFIAALLVFGGGATTFYMVVWIYRGEV